MSTFAEIIFLYENEIFRLNYRNFATLFFLKSKAYLRVYSVKVFKRISRASHISNLPVYFPFNTCNMEEHIHSEKCDF